MSKKRLKQPDQCPSPVYDIMMTCWEHHPTSRPSAAEISARLAGLDVADKLMGERRMLVLTEEDVDGVHM